VQRCKTKKDLCDYIKDNRNFNKEVASKRVFDISIWKYEGFVPNSYTLMGHSGIEIKGGG